MGSSVYVPAVYEQLMARARIKVKSSNFRTYVGERGQVYITIGGQVYRARLSKLPTKFVLEEDFDTLSQAMLYAKDFADDGFHDQHIYKKVKTIKAR